MNVSRNLGGTQCLECCTARYGGMLFWKSKVSESNVLAYYFKLRQNLLEQHLHRSDTWH